MIAYEPEVATLHCVSMPASQVTVRTRDNIALMFKPGCSFLVLDLGGNHIRTGLYFCRYELPVYKCIIPYKNYRHCINSWYTLQRTFVFYNSSYFCRYVNFKMYYLYITVHYLYINYKLCMSFSYILQRIFVFTMRRSVFHILTLKFITCI